MQSLDLQIDMSAKAMNLKKGMIVSRGSGPKFEVLGTSAMNDDGILVQGKNTTHGGLVEIGCFPDTEFQIAT